MSTNREPDSAARRRKSFIACLGLSPRVGVKQGERSARHKTHVPIPSSPQLLAAYGHSHGFGSGQHPSHYSMGIVSVMAAVGVAVPPLPSVLTEERSDAYKEIAPPVKQPSPVLEMKRTSINQHRRHSFGSRAPSCSSASSSEYSLSVAFTPPPEIQTNNAKAKTSRRPISILRTSLPYRTDGEIKAAPQSDPLLPSDDPFPRAKDGDQTQFPQATAIRRDPSSSHRAYAHRGSPPPEPRKKIRLPPSPAVKGREPSRSREFGTSTVKLARTTAETSVKRGMLMNNRARQRAFDAERVKRRNSDYASYAVQLPLDDANALEQTGPNLSTTRDVCDLIDSDLDAKGETRLGGAADLHSCAAQSQCRKNNPNASERTETQSGREVRAAAVRKQTNKSCMGSEGPVKQCASAVCDTELIEFGTLSVPGRVKHSENIVKRILTVAQPHADFEGAGRSVEGETEAADGQYIREENVDWQIVQPVKLRQRANARVQSTHSNLDRQSRKTDAVQRWIENGMQANKQTNATPLKKTNASDKQLNGSFERRCTDTSKSGDGSGTRAEADKLCHDEQPIRRRGTNLGIALPLTRSSCLDCQQNKQKPRPLFPTPSSSVASTLVTALASLPSDRSIRLDTFESTTLGNMPGTFSPLTSVLQDEMKVGESSSSIFESAFGGDYNEFESDSDACSIASSANEDAAHVSPRAHMTLQKKAQLRASRLLNMHSKRISTRQQSLFDSMEQNNDHKDEVRAVQRERRRIVARSSSSSSSLSTSSSNSLTSRSELSINTPPSCTSDLGAHPFVSELGCWMEEADVNTTTNDEEHSTLVRHMSGVSLSSPTSAASHESTRKAPPRPPRHNMRERQVESQEGSSASGASWSSLRRVPMYTRLGHLPLRLVEPPSSMSWRSRIGKAEFERLSLEFEPREMRRQEVIEEFYVTESNFITAITGILRTFSEPLRFSDNAFHGDVPMEVARLFHDLDEILAVHVKMFQALDTIIKAHPTALVVSMAGSISPIVQELAVYQSYLIRYESVIKLWDAIRTSEKKGELSWFVETMERQESNPECMGMTLGSFLLKPVQRLMKYPLFFKQLDELVDSEHPDAMATTQLNKSMEQLIRNMNTVKAREEDFEQLKQLETIIKGLPEGFVLASRQRQLLKQGVVRCVRLSDSQRSSLAERSRWALPSPVHRIPSPLLQTLSPLQQQSEAVRELRRSSLTNGSSEETSPRTSSDDTASAWSHDSFAATTPSAASFTSRSSFSSSYNVGLQYFDLKAQNTNEDAASAHTDYKWANEDNLAVAPKRKANMTSFLLRTGSTASSAASHNDKHAPVVECAEEEEEVYAFVFDDICLLTRKEQKVIKVASSKKKPAVSTIQDSFTVLQHGGVSRILALKNVSKCINEHQQLLEVEVMPINKTDGRSARNGLAGTVSFYFSFGEQEPAANAWYTSFDRCFCSSIMTNKQSANTEAAKAVQAQVDWARREKQVTEKVVNAAKACDRVNLAALLQTGLPYPRSPAQQKLSDMAVRTAAHVEWHGVKARDLFKPVAAASSAPSTPADAKPGMRPRLRSSNSAHNLHRSMMAIDAESIPRMGDADAMRGIQTWAEERREERAWWDSRLSQIVTEAEQEQEINKMLEVRRSRAVVVPTPLLDAPTPLAVPVALPAVPSSCSSPARTVRVRRGLPILKIGSNDPVLAH